MNLKYLSDEDLLSKTEALVQKEREILTDVLHHLREIERRRLYSALGFPSLFEYAMGKLGYSNDQAYRRIAAMRLLKEIPEIEDKINSGAMTLSHLSLAQNHFRQESKLTQQPLSKEKKLEVLAKLENKSTREAHKIVLSLSSNPVNFIPEKIRLLNEELSEIRFAANEVLRNKIEKLKGLVAHTNPNITLAELFEKLCDLGIEKWDLSAQPSKAGSRRIKGKSGGDKVNQVLEESEIKPEQKGTLNSSIPVWTSKVNVRQRRGNLERSGSVFMENSKSHGLNFKPNRYISASLKREVWQKAKGKCANCGSMHALQVDHIKPVAMGGLSSRENLRLLCRSCNQRMAIEKLGLQKMGAFLN